MNVVGGVVEDVEERRIQSAGPHVGFDVDGASAAASSPCDLYSASSPCAGPNGIAHPAISDDRSTASRISISSASAPARSPSLRIRSSSPHHSEWCRPRTISARSARPMVKSSGVVMVLHGTRPKDQRSIGPTVTTDHSSAPYPITNPHIRVIMRIFQGSFEKSVTPELTIALLQSTLPRRIPKTRLRTAVMAGLAIITPITFAPTAVAEPESQSNTVEVLPLDASGNTWAPGGPGATMTIDVKGDGTFVRTAKVVYTGPVKPDGNACASEFQIIFRTPSGPGDNSYRLPECGLVQADHTFEVNKHMADGSQFCGRANTTHGWTPYACIKIKK